VLADRQQQVNCLLEQRIVVQAEAKEGERFDGRATADDLLDELSQPVGRSTVRRLQRTSLKERR
jgi:hypothetical protein